MISVRSFVDEMEKIAAVKSRRGAVPIHVHNLAKKVLVDKRLKKLASAKEGIEIAKKVLPPAGIFLAGALSAHALSQAKRDWEIGRQMRQQGMV